MKSKNLWLKLITVILIFTSLFTLIACEEGLVDESGSDLNNNGNAAVDNGIRAEDLTPSQNLTFSLTSDKKGYQLKSASKCKDEQIVIPASYTGTDGKALPVTAIAASAFKGMRSVVSVYIPDTVTKISASAFKEAKSLTTVVCGNGITEISNNAFEGCKSLKSISMKEGIKKIGKYAFAGCEHLETIVIPNTVETIGEACFQRCARMTSVTLGSGIKTQDKVDKKGKVTDNKDEIGRFAFYFCKNISTIRYTGTKEDFEALHMDVSCFLSTTMTDDVICAGGQKAKLPELQGQLELPKEYQ